MNGWPLWSRSGMTQWASVQSIATQSVGKSTTYWSGPVAIDDLETVAGGCPLCGLLRLSLGLRLVVGDRPTVLLEAGRRQPDLVGEAVQAALVGGRCLASLACHERPNPHGDGVPAPRVLEPCARLRVG